MGRLTPLICGSRYSQPFSPSLAHTRSMASLMNLSEIRGEGLESFVQAKAAFDRGYKHMTPRSTICSSRLGRRGLVEHSFISWSEPGESVDAVRPLGYISPRYPRGAPHLLSTVGSPASMPQLKSPISARPSTSWGSSQGRLGGQSPYRKENTLAILRAAENEQYTPRPYTAPERGVRSGTAPPVAGVGSTRSPEDEQKVVAARAAARTRVAERLRQQRSEVAKPTEEERVTSEEQTHAAIETARERSKEMRKLERQLSAKQRQAEAQAAERAHRCTQRVKAERDLTRQRAREWAAKQRRKKGAQARDQK